MSKVEKLSAGIDTAFFCNQCEEHRVFSTYAHWTAGFLLQIIINWTKKTYLKNIILLNTHDLDVKTDWYELNLKVN